MFFISFILLEVFILIIFKQSQISQDSGERLIHSYDVLRLERQAIIDAMNLANDEQYYVLTGAPEYAKAFDQTRDRLNTQLKLLSIINVDSASYEKNILMLRDNIQVLERVTQNHVDAIRRKNVTADSLKSFASETQRAIEVMRSTYEILTKNEPDIIQTRRAEASGKHENYLWTLGIGTVLELGIIIVGNLVIFSLVARNARAKEELRRNEKLSEVILNGLNDGIFDYNLMTGDVTYSPSYQKMMGYSVEELNGPHDNFYKYVHPEDLKEGIDVMENFVRGSDMKYTNTFRMLRKDGHWMWVMSRGIAIRDRTGMIVRLIGTHTDITAQKQREEELAYFIRENEDQRLQLGHEKEKAEAASQAKSDFLATMSHEIRTPMNAVVGLSSLMLETKLNAKQQQMMENISSNADVLLWLVNDLLDISRIEAAQIELETRPFTFDGTFKALRSMFESQVTSKGLQLEINNDIGDQSYLGDPARIQQILINLVGNAFKFTREGKVAIHADIASHDGDDVLARIAVSDTGVGIPPEKIGLVFDKFVQADQTISRRFGGSGLGLAICKSLIELMGGDIDVSSEVGKGSVFTLSVPLRVNKAVPQVKRIKKQEDVMEATAAGGIVLVVEDYAPNVLVATLMLENLGYTVEVANNGAQALDKIRTCEKPYVAIMMDVQMPDMSGYDTTKQVREIEKERGFRHTIIGLTAHALAGDQEKCLEAGMDDYMTKPINLTLLADKLGRLAQAA